MNYVLACQAVNFAGKLGLNQGFALIMFDLDLDLTGNTKKNLSATWSKDWDERAFQSTLLLSVNNNVSKEYLTFVEDVKRNRTGSLSQAHTVGTKMAHFSFLCFPLKFLSLNIMPVSCFTILFFFLKVFSCISKDVLYIIFYFLVNFICIAFISVEKMEYICKVFIDKQIGSIIIII